MNRWHLAFPDVPRGFWKRFFKRWHQPLKTFEKTITLAESFGVNPRAPYFESRDDGYWLALRSLHSHACLQARAVFVLLTNGLVDPAWIQWRSCHEAATVALFIADHPETAHRYLQHASIEKNHLARSMIDVGHPDAPSKGDARDLDELAQATTRELKQEYGLNTNTRNYKWSGFSSFAQIESKVQDGWRWQARPEYIFASQHAHAVANASMPVEFEDGSQSFVIGPTNGGLTGPADLTCLSLMHVTLALMTEASTKPENDADLLRLAKLVKIVGVSFWLRDPLIICSKCGGFFNGASPPEELTPPKRPQPCNCDG